MVRRLSLSHWCRYDVRITHANVLLRMASAPLLIPAMGFTIDYRTNSFESGQIEAKSVVA